MKDLVFKNSELPCLHVFADISNVTNNALFTYCTVLYCTVLFFTVLCCTKNILLYDICNKQFCQFILV